MGKFELLKKFDGVENAGVIVSENQLSSLTSDSSSELNILGHDGHTLGVNGGKVSVLEKTDEVSFSSLLESQNSAGLESEICLEILRNLPYETLEGKLSDKELCTLLITSNLSQSDSSRSRSMGLLDSPSRRC